ncbi:MAG: nickel pincer cofactor biosynthesis protein LarB [Chloroflexi bacterium]|jgi:NCAIR mutase (PurE)-related protein|nr:nickel pincer cofactor biosynthesis protein LarB [Chloroflexota bacterium]NCA14459.1 nickel pincer cofactor biosynthesis protein LarB [Pseudomonadota bacterium]
MDERDVRILLEGVAEGRVAVGEALRRLQTLDTAELGFARIDRHRAMRRGFPEVIYAEGKTPDQVAAIAVALYEAGNPVLATRCNPDAASAVAQVVPGATYHAVARCTVALPAPIRPVPGRVVIATGGTTDIPVAEEAALTSELTGVSVDRLWDVGVAGIHRLLANAGRFDDADVIIAVAGMEGALPSVIAGLVACPVIAVPTSVGYGAAFGGIAPMLGMLTTCSPGVAVVNIDNGFGAGYLAGTIARRSARP